MKLKELVKETCWMQYVDGEQAWYATEKSHFLFPVPLNEIGDGILRPTEKGILLMKWIKAHIQYIEDARENQ